jgi:hypothetical protein
MSDYAVDGLLTYDGALKEIAAFSKKLEDASYVNTKSIEELIGELKGIVNKTSNKRVSVIWNFLSKEFMNI